MPAPPAALAAIPRWVVWRTQIREGVPTKPPFTIRNTHASSTEPKDWSDHPSVVATIERNPDLFDGAGIILGPITPDAHIAGIDLDTCLHDGFLADWAQPFLDILPTYTEISPSGTGLKLFFHVNVADIPAVKAAAGIAENQWGRKRTFGEAANGNKHPPAAEIYLAARFFTVTGNRLLDAPEHVATATPAQLAEIAAIIGHSRTAAAGDGTDTYDGTIPDDAELAAKLTAAFAADRRIAARWNGSAHGLNDTSRSALDMSLGALLKSQGFTLPEMRAALLNFPHGAGNDHAQNDRYFERIWNRTSTQPPPEPPDDDVPPPDEPASPQPNWPELANTGHATETNALKLHFYDDIQPSLETIDFVEDTLVERSAAVVYGESNSGKTFWTLYLALCIASGKTWFGKTVIQGGVVYLSLEGSQGFHNRVAAWRQEIGEDTVVHFAAITSTVDMLRPDADVPRVIAAIHEAAAHFQLPVKLIVIDTLSRAMAGGDENSPEDMGALVRHQDEIRTATGAMVLWIHHSGKDAAKGARGHSMLRAAVDTEIEITADDDGHAATVTKQRDLEGGQSYRFTLNRVDLGENARGKPVSSCVVAQVEAPATNGRPTLNGHNARALELLTDVIAGGGKSGYRGTPPDLPSVPEEWWRERFYSSAMAGAERKAKEKAYRRAADFLVENRYVGMAESRVWLR